MLNTGKILSLFAIAFVLLIPTTVFAETYEVIIQEESSIDGCEKTDSCLSPSKLELLKGDSVNWVREQDTSHFIVSYNSDGQKEWATMDYSHTFKDAGYYEYTISEFPWVKGIINVQYTQAVANIPNNIKFSNIEKIGDELHLDYEGHLDTTSGVLHVYAESGQHVLNIEIPASSDGSFSKKLIDPDDYYWTWVSGNYQTEFWSVDGDNGNKKSEIVKSSFSLVVDSEPYDVQPADPEQVIEVLPSQELVEGERIVELEEQLDRKNQQIRDLKLENIELKKQIENLNAIIMEQVKVIYEWVIRV